MSVINISLIVILIFTVTACSSKPKNHKQNQRSFETEIKEDGSKRFIASIVKVRQNKGRNSEPRGNGNERGGRGGERGQRGGNGNAGGEPGGQRSANAANIHETGNQDNRKQIVAYLNEEIKKTGYCRRGYIELDYSSIKGETEFRGECQESASSEDKVRWKQ